MSSTITTPAAVPAAVANIDPQPRWKVRLSQVFWVNSVAISDNGTRVVAATFIHDYQQRNARFLPNVKSRFGTYCFNATGQLVDDKPPELWRDEYDGWDGVFGVTISGDGQVAAASGWLERGDNLGVGLLRAYDVNNRGRILLDYSGCDQRVSWVALSQDGSTLAAVADDVYVFLRDGGAFNPLPIRFGAGGRADRYMTSVAVHHTGKWLVACDHIGHVYGARIANGALQQLRAWAAPQRATPFLSVAIARDAETFAVAGGNDLFVFTFSEFIEGRAAPVSLSTVDHYTPMRADGSVQENLRWIAVSADGEKIVAVANRNDGKGLLFGLDARLEPLWPSVHLDRNPNGASIDARGTFIAVADGFPTSTASSFRLFNAATGEKIWSFPTSNMNWPIVVNPEGTAVVAGGDDGIVYYFTQAEAPHA